MHRFATPAQFNKFSSVLLPISVAVTALCFALGLYGAFHAPVDYQQGQAVRIMYIHVPAAWMSSFLYGAMALLSASFLIWRHPLADTLAREAASIGIVFTLITLATGMLWGKPMWGAYWVWDARLTSVLVLLLLYIGYITLAQSGEHDERSKVACAWLALIGAINLPIIKFSVQWWNTLHQPASLIRAGGTSIHPAMLWPLLTMAAAYALLFAALLLLRVRTALLLGKVRRRQLAVDG